MSEWEQLSLFEYLVLRWWIVGEGLEGVALSKEVCRFTGSGLLQAIS